MFNTLKIECQACDEPYAAEIRRWFLNTFPGSGPKIGEDRLELVFEALMGTGKTRLGPKPNPESQVAIRQVIRSHIEANLPIPILVPWGSEKPNGARGVDIAEIAGLRTLFALNERVEAHGAKLEFRIRIEDASAPFLFIDRQEEAAAQAAAYTRQLMGLINILSASPTRLVVIGVPESTRMHWQKFNNAAGQYVDQFVRYIQETDIYGTAGGAARASFKELEKLGWIGTIPMEQREYYRGVYRKLYNMSDEQATQTLARYLASSLARIKYDLTGVPSFWKEMGHLQLSFVPPVPGAPKTKTARTIYYRTLPENVSSNHIPPWRAKGYLEVTGHDRIRPRLTSFSENREYHPSSVILSNENERITVDCDYVVKG